MPLPEGFLQELKDRSDMTEIASSYVNLKRRGRNMVGLCPFHGEKTPSFNIYPENGSFYCFGCGVGGDVITFIMKIENLDYIDAVKYLAQRAGMTMPEDTFDDSMSNLRKRIFEANREAARFFYKNLYSDAGREGLEYFHGRALTDKTIRRFGLGYADSNRYSLCGHLKTLGFKNNEIVSANLAFQNKNGGISDRFNDRVMFPIIDLRGNVIAFGGRIMTNQKPKYLNTSDTPVFKKSANLFSLNNAKNSDDRTLILCEGYMDVIAVNQAGFPNAVATLGTALTQEQALLMKRYADEVIICYDSDEAGQKATARAITFLRNAGLNIKVINIPQGKDPDEFLRNKGENGHDAFKNVIEGSGNDIEYRLTKLRRNYNLKEAEGKVAFLSEAVKILATLDNSIEQDVYISKLCKELEVTPDAVKQQLKKVSRKQYYDRRRDNFRNMRQNLNRMNDKVNTESYKKPRVTTAEEGVIAYIIKNPDRMSYVESKLSAEKFQTEFNRKLYLYFSERIKNNLDPLATVSGDFTQEETAKIYHIANSDYARMANEKTAEENIKVINDEYSKLKVADAANASLDDIAEELKRLKDSRK
ncbi:MAG: DNA primase [Ruminococcus sp.]|nr:DNA primase [Ruminococcus sp.]